MKKNLFFYLIFLFSINYAYCQTGVKLLKSQTFTSKGAVALGDLNFGAIPNGTSRMMVVTTYVERVHSTPGNNHIIANYSTISDKFLDVTLNNIGLNDLNWSFANINNAATGATETTQLNSSSLISVLQTHYITENTLNSMSSGILKFTNLKIPNNAGDEIIVSVQLYDNVYSVGYVGITNNINSSLNPFSVVKQATTTLQALQPARTEQDRFYVGISYTNREETLTTNFTNIISQIVNNVVGISTQTSTIDGIRLNIDYTKNQASSPTYTVTRGTSLTNNHIGGYLYALNPVGRVSTLTGKVHHDITNNSNVDGTGTNLGAFFVNFINSNNMVTAVASVNSDGSLTIIEGEILLSGTYTAQLTKNKGVIGNAPPLSELNTNWIYTGESRSTTGNDGTIDGKLSFSPTTSTVNDLYFGIRYTLDTDSDGINDIIDLDDDNDGILDAVECNSNERIVNGVFPTSGDNTNILYGWSVAGTTSTVWPTTTGKINLNLNGLEFRRDESTITSVKQSMSNKNLRNGTITLSNVKWYRSTNLLNQTTTEQNFNFELLVGGKRYLTITNPNGYQPTVLAENGATTLTTQLSRVDVNGAASSATPSITIQLPNDSTLHQGEVELRFTAGTSPRNVHDLMMSAISITSCVDTDNDGLQDPYDLDSDGDGCYDAIEGAANITTAQLTSGRINGPVSATGIPTAVGSGQGAGVAYDNSKSDCLDSDSDGVPNYLDLDNDNDGIIDSVESPMDANGIPTCSTTNATIPTGGWATGNGLNKERLVFFDWTGKTLSPTQTSISSEFVYNNVTYKATITNYRTTATKIASTDPRVQQLVGGDANTWSGGGDQMVWKKYNTPTNGEVLRTVENYNASGLNEFTINITATNNSTNIVYPVNVVVFDGESTSVNATINEKIKFSTNGSAFKLLETLGTGNISSVTSYSSTTPSNTIEYINTQSTSTSGIFYTTGVSPTITTTINRTSLESIPTSASEGQQAVGFAILLMCDFDNDGKPNHLDEDSDGDGCPDAIEGGDNVKWNELRSNNTISVGSTGGVNAQGVPNLVNPGGYADADTQIGQTIGASSNASIANCNTIDARNDNFTNPKINNTTGGIAGNVNLNDFYNKPLITLNPNVTPRDFTYTITNDGGVTGASFDSDGNLVVPAGLTPNIYTLTYRICSTADSTICDTATIIFQVYIDSDRDGVSDVVDLDDDNDGILDTVESAICAPSSIDNYYTENFGTGSRTNFNTLTRPTTTTYIYEPNNFNPSDPSTNLQDGEYAVVSNLNNLAGWSTSPPLDATTGNAWVTSDDHTPGDTDGRMAVFNASRSFTENFITVNNIGTVPADKTIKISFWAKNLDKSPANMNSTWEANRALPSIKVNILNAGGSVIQEFTTGTIPRDEQWHEYTAFVRTGANTTIGYSMFNIVEGGNGNDLAIDDITFTSICDSDSDGIPNELDLDSDNDGCADALEGSEGITRFQIHSINLPSTDPNYIYKGQIKVIYDGKTENTPENIISTSPNALGVPQLVNNAGNNMNRTTNTGNLGGVADNKDNTAEVGQGNVSSHDINWSEACKSCHRPPNLSGPGLPTNVGISTLGEHPDWPQNRKGAHLVIESKTKGLVLPRMTTDQLAAIPKGDLKIGMLVFDVTNNCIKAYTNNNLGVPTWQCMQKPTCEIPL